MWMNELSDAAENGDIEKLNDAIKQEPSNSDRYSDRYSDALWRAAKSGHVECVKTLIPFIDKSEDVEFALNRAASNGHISCLKLFLSQSPATCKKTDALYISAIKGHSECVKLLIPVSDAAHAISILKNNDKLEAASLVEAFLQQEKLLSPLSPSNSPDKNNAL